VKIIDRFVNEYPFQSFGIMVTLACLGMVFLRDCMR
jgi:hypothetical protein